MRIDNTQLYSDIVPKASGSYQCGSAAIAFASGVFDSIKCETISGDGSALTNLPSAGSIPSGGIIMWSGSIATIPAGWYLCDGNNGTPDLRDRFVVGAKQDVGGVAKTNLSGALTQSGGSTTIGVTQIPSHTHNLSVYGGAGSTYPFSGGNHGSYQGAFATDGGSGGGQPYTQPYFALAFIMKS